MYLAIIITLRRGGRKQVEESPTSFFRASLPRILFWQDR
jgi:hypothetical protein